MEEVSVDEVTAREKSSTLSVWLKRLIVVAAAVAVLAHLLVAGWGGYVYTYVKCGLRQPMIASSFENSKVYHTPDNRRYSIPGEGMTFRGYYCTEPQARADGFLRAGP